jgi:hypothetical protein
MNAAETSSGVLISFAAILAQSLIDRRSMMRVRPFIAVCGLVLAGAAFFAVAQVPPVAAPDQAALLKSSDPKLAANKKLVFDMYRAIIQAGRTDLAPQFFTESYIQHNPNVKTGRDELAGAADGVDGHVSGDIDHG